MPRRRTAVLTGLMMGIRVMSATPTHSKNSPTLFKGIALYAEPRMPVMDWSGVLLSRRPYHAFNVLTGAELSGLVHLINQREDLKRNTGRILPVKLRQ